MQAGERENLYVSFLEKFEAKLTNLGIDASKRISVPGNHDLSRQHVGDNLTAHEALVSKQLDEKEFNDYCSKSSNLLIQKFANYHAFEKRFAKFGTAGASGSGWQLSDDLGVYCLNTALCSSGGIEYRGSKINDEGRLCVDTRNLYSWLSSSNSKWNILITHHPIDWLSDWSQRELKLILEKKFCLHLLGHVHNQDIATLLVDDGSLTTLTAPALFTRKSEDLGYALITVCDERGPLSVQYRQWTKRQRFVTGSNFSNTDDGQRKLRGAGSSISGELISGEGVFHRHYYGQKLEQSLKSYASQPAVWINPSVRTHSELETNVTPKEILLDELITDVKSIVIKAPPQYGLTSLGYFLCKEAASAPGNPLWLYIDLNDFNVNGTDNHIREQTQFLGGKVENVRRIVIDGFSNYDKSSQKKLVRISNLFKDQPLTILQTVDERSFGVDAKEWPENRTFATLFLWSLSRSNIRQLVVRYNEITHVGDDSAVLRRIANDLEVLNLPRTAFNCLTILKAMEYDFDESPVNRTEMIKRVLFLLFNLDDIPRYQTKPDLKDCEYVLGWFCEQLIKSNTYTFERQSFISRLKDFCQKQVIALEVHVVFDVLAANGIIVERDDRFCFRFSYWIYYFAAQRMHQDATFADYMLSESRYISFPEIIEFYTGIDRRREDALTRLTEDINKLRAVVDEKCGIPDSLDAYKLIKWQPAASYLEQVKAELGEGARKSKLPDSVKEEFADKQYDRARPYNQQLANILNEYSLRSLMRALRGAARALRNSDYASPETRRLMLQAILDGWVLLGKVMLVLSPILAEKRSANFDGATFQLDNAFSDDKDKRLNEVILSMPINIIRWYHDDVFSQKMSPLLYDSISKKNIGVMDKHLILLLILMHRPNQWRKIAEDYIASLSKDSFYLSDVYLLLRSEYKFSTVSDDVLSEIEYLIKMCIAKHKLGNDKPGRILIAKVGDNVLPKRDDTTQ